MARAEAELLAGRAQAIAKGWLLTLLERVPLAAVATIPASALAAEGPGVCAALARALASDGELDRLRPEGDLAPAVRRIGPLTGAGDAAATLAAVDALRACLWTAALEARDGRPDATDVAALAERLAHVALVTAATALGSAGAHAVGQDEAGAAAGDGGERTAAAAHADAAAAVDASGAAHTPAPAEPVPAADPPPAPGPQPVRIAALPARPVAVEEMEDGELWVATLERHLDRCRREGGGLALLRVELVDGERLAASAPAGEGGVPYGRLAQAIRRAIRRQDLVASDHQGRAWVIAPAVGRAGAAALAERIGAGVERGEDWRGAPLAATIGFAVYGEDGEDAVALIERAEEAMLAASAAGAPIGEAPPAGPDGGGAGGRSGPRLVR